MRARLRQTGKLRLSYGRAPCAALLSRWLHLPRPPRAPSAVLLPRRPRMPRLRLHAAPAARAFRRAAAAQAAHPRLTRVPPLPRSPRASCRRALSNPRGLAHRGAACGRVDKKLIND